MGYQIRNRKLHAWAERSKPYLNRYRIYIMMIFFAVPCASGLISGYCTNSINVAMSAVMISFLLMAVWAMPVMMLFDTIEIYDIKPIPTRGGMLLGACVVRPYSEVGFYHNIFDSGRYDIADLNIENPSIKDLGVLIKHDDRIYAIWENKWSFACRANAYRGREAYVVSKTRLTMTDEIYWLRQITLEDGT